MDSTLSKKLGLEAMSVQSSEHTEHILNTVRLVALADGVFAFAMTLLVLNIDIPTSIPLASPNMAILQFLIKLLPKLGIYIISFITLGLAWYAHQRLFHFLKYIDVGLLWINLIILMLIALVPFTTSLGGEYGNYQIGIVPWYINFLIVNLIFSYQWYYIISRPMMLSHKLNSLEVARTKERYIIQIAIPLSSIGISFFSPAWSVLPFILLLPYLSVSRRYRLTK